MVFQVFDGFVKTVKIEIGFTQIKKRIDDLAFSTFLQIRNRFLQFTGFVAACAIPEVIVCI